MVTATRLLKEIRHEPIHFPFLMEKDAVSHEVSLGTHLGIMGNNPL